MQNILVTGGAGYIGSHTCVQLLEAGHSVAVIDNLSNSKREALDRVGSITGSAVTFFEADLLDVDRLDEIFQKQSYDAVIHFAGLKAVGESVRMPLTYYHNNVSGTINLLHAMDRADLSNIVFSSSATVYGDPRELPLTESAPLSTTNPYASTKYMIEEILRDLYGADDRWNIAILRYFNPVGAHPSGLIGEDPSGIPNNLFPYISRVAVGSLPRLNVYGNDYPTADGTGVRDYIHVVDLAEGHLAALRRFAEQPGLMTYNLGTGTGYSVLDIIKAYGRAAGHDIPYDITDRRPGDIAACYADPGKAERELGWTAKLDLDAMCRDSWNWQSKNPDGYC